MPRWLKKVGGNLADTIVDKVTDEIQDHGFDLGEVGDAVSTLTAKGQEVAALSRETIQICDDTACKRQQMVEFGSEIQATLQAGFALDATNNKKDASILETIRQLTDGDKVEGAQELATGLDQAARMCVDKSMQMMDCIEQGMDSLPAPLQAALEGGSSSNNNNGQLGGDLEDDVDDPDGSKNHNPNILVHSLERDLQDVQTCLDAIRQLNLSTALAVGVRAFGEIAGKARRAQTLFDAVRAFASDAAQIAHALCHLDAVQLASRSRDLLRCLRVLDDMRRVARGATQLMDALVGLFQATADRISVLWAALAFARDCMADCVAHAQEAKQLCGDAKEKSVMLVAKSRSVQEQLQKLGQFNGQSVSALQSLTQAGEIQEAIDLATHMDDLVVECSSKVVAMVDRVNEGFKNLPDILTEDVDVEAAGTGRQEGEPEPANVEPDIAELEKSRSAIESSDLISAGKAGVRGFEGVSEKATVCTDLLDLVEQFSVHCNLTIESFLSVWDLESAGKKITEMCQLVNLGSIMKQLADRIKRLLVAIIALMKAAVTKLKNLDFGDVGETLVAVKDDLEQEVDDLKDQVKYKLQFWKK